MFYIADVSEEEDNILSEESFGEGSFQNAHGYELAIDKVDYDYESGEEHNNSGKRDQVSEEKEVFASENILPELKSLPASETHLSSGWEQVKVEMRSNDGEDREDQDNRGSKEGSQETAVLSAEEIHREEALLREGDSLPGEENPQNYRRPCIPYLGSHGEPRAVMTPFFLGFTLTLTLL